MKLSLKAVRFVIEALEHYEKYHEQQLQQERTSEDDASDLDNDREFVEALRQDFIRYRDELTHHCELKADI